MREECPTQSYFDPEKTPIHFRFSTFIVVVGSIVSLAIALGGAWAMLNSHDKELSIRRPVIERIPIIEVQQAEIGKRLDRIDQNIQALTDKLIYKK